MSIFTMSDVYTIRDAATEIGDTDLSWDLHEIGDKIAEQLKLEIDTKQTPQTHNREKGSEWE